MCVRMCVCMCVCVCVYVCVCLWVFQIFFFHPAPFFKANFESVWDGKLELSSICIGCGDLEITNMHPLFNGGYCTPCKVRKGVGRFGGVI